MKGNQFYTAVKVSIGLCVLGVGLILWAFLVHDDQAFNWAHPEPFFAMRMAFGSGFLLIGLIGVWQYGIYAKNMERLVSGETALADWTLTPAEHQAFATAVYEREQGANASSIFAVGFLVGLTLLFQLIARLDFWIIALIVLGILLIWVIIGFIIPKFRLRRMLRQEIARATVGLRMGRVLGAAAIWPQVYQVTLERGEAVHIMTIRHLQQHWVRHSSPLMVHKRTHHYTVYIPVPLDKYDEGLAIARAIAEEAQAELVESP